MSSSWTPEDCTVSRPRTRVEVEERQPGNRHRAEVAARALDGQDPSRRPGDRVSEGHFGRRVATGEVGDSLVGAQAVGAFQQGGKGRVVSPPCSLIGHVR